MGQRLLLVDNDRSFLKEHQVSLEAAFDLEVVGSPDQVLNHLEKGTFAAVLICVEVAENKGYALCSTIRRHAKLGGVKLALISAKATEEEFRRHQSLKGRADLYLHKPIAPSALVAALRPLVPGLALDPDNPLGELVDTELGDDWLDGLKSALDGPASAPVFGVRPSSPVQTTNLDAKATSPLDAGRLRLLEEQVSALHEELRTKDQLLRAAEAEAQQVQRQLNSVTLNLDELERSNREAEALKTQLEATRSALRGLEELHGREGENAQALKAQLMEALTERTEMIQQVETLNHQVGEKAQRAIELLKERDRLLHENMDLEPFRAKAQELEATLAAKQQELDEVRQAQAHLNATIEGLVEQQTGLKDVHEATLLEVAGYKEKAHTYQLELAGLEATMRGQGRDLAELGMQLRRCEAELAASQSLVLERDQQILARQELLQQHQEEATRLTGQTATLLQELDEARVQHEGQQLELMNGLDEKEAEVVRLNQLVEDQLESYATVEREKQSVHGQLSEHRDRLQNLEGLLQEIQDKVRQGSDLAKG
jgi:DNA-binding response OmpR family regulator